MVHAWFIRTARGPAQRRFLTNLRVAVADEVQVHEDVLETNAAFMFRRLDAAALQADNPFLSQYIAATATIRSPGKRMQGLTGRTLRKVDLEDNGAPTHATKLLRVPYPRGRRTPSPAHPVS